MSLKPFSVLVCMATIVTTLLLAPSRAISSLCVQDLWIEYAGQRVEALLPNPQDVDVVVGYENCVEQEVRLHLSREEDVPYQIGILMLDGSGSERVTLSGPLHSGIYRVLLSEQDDESVVYTVTFRVQFGFFLPLVLKRYNAPGAYYTPEVHVVDSRGYIVWNEPFGDVSPKTFEVLDLTDPATPVSLGRDQIQIPQASRVHVAGDYAYISAGYSLLDRIFMFDISDIHSIQSRGDFYGGDRWLADFFFVYDQYVYIPHYSPPWCGWTVICDWLGQCTSIYECFAARSALSVYDTSDPDNPRHHILPGIVVQGAALFGDHIIGTYADQTAQLVTVSMTNPLTPTIVAQIPSPTDKPLVFTIGDGKAIAYVGAHHDFGWDNQLWIVEIASPDSPQVVGSYTLPGAISAVTSRADRMYVLFYSQSEIAIPSGNGADTLRLVDISNPSAPRPLGSYINPPQLGRPVWGKEFVVVGDYVYVMATEALHILDTSDPGHIQTVRFFARDPNLR